MALQREKTAVLAFGRMNPPTTGHEKLIKKTHQVARQHGGSAHVVTSHSHDSNKNPIPQDKKIGYLKKIAPHGVNVSGSSKQHPTIMHHASKLHAAGHKHLVVVAGGDRIKEFHNTLNKYNGKSGAHGHYNFKSIKVVSSGRRDPDSDSVQGVSGTKMRHYAKTGQHNKFKQGLPRALHPHAKEIHNHVGGTQLESFKEAMEKKFKPSGEKTDIILHTNATGSKKNKDGKGAPSNTTRAGGTRFGEGRYMRMVNAEFENFIGDELDEVLSRQARIKKALILRRYKHKIQRRKKMMRKKLATKDMLVRRARRHAVKLVRKRFMGKKGENYAKLGMADKILIDKKIAEKKAIIDRIANRLLPKVRRAELIRLRDMKKKKPVPSKKPVTSGVVKPGGTWANKSSEKAAKVSSYRLPQKVKSESFVNEDNIFDVVDAFEMLSEKDITALDKKFAKSNIDPNILFEVFLMGLDNDGEQTPQQKGFMSLNTFMAEDYNTPAASEVGDEKQPYEAAITNLALNTKNRNMAIKSYHYGPLNEDDDEYWEAVADLWDTDTDTAKGSRCHNCAAFDRAPKTLKKIAEAIGPDGNKVVEKAQLGYCELFAFKCAGQRVCDAWIGGGPITEQKQLDEALADWMDQPITGVQLDRRYNRPMVAKSALPRLKEFKASGEDSSIEDPVDPKKIDWEDSHTLAAYKMGQKAKGTNKKCPFAKKNDPEGQMATCWNMGKRGEPIPEALEYPHETAKKYKKDTPGQNEDLQLAKDKPKVHTAQTSKQTKDRIAQGNKQASDRMAQRNKQHALKKKRDHEYEMKHGRKKDPKNLRDIASSKINEKAVNELDTETLRSYQRKASDASKYKKLSTKKVDNRYSGVKRASDTLDKRHRERMKQPPRPGGTQLEDAEAAQRAAAQNKIEKLRQKERHKTEKERLATAHKNEVQRLRANEQFEELFKK